MKLPIGRAESVLNLVFSAMTEVVVHAESIELRGSGSFTVREYGS